MHKPILCLDFDGVCHSYISGWQGPTTIPDHPVDGMWEFLENAIQHFEIAIVSSRSGYHEGIEAMKYWFFSHAMLQYQRDMVNDDLSFLTGKPPAFLTIDDRAITFTGIWPSIEDLKNFKTWQQK
jgi:predicted phosphatase